MTQGVAAAFAFNSTKASEYDPDVAVAPPVGASVKASDPIAGASTISEPNGSEKGGSGSPNFGQNPTVGPLDRVRVDSTARTLTTNQGVPIGDNQSSELLSAWRIETALPDGEPDSGLIVATTGNTPTDDFVAAVAKHRHFARETEPPRV